LCSARGKKITSDKFPASQEIFLRHCFQLWSGAELETQAVGTHSYILRASGFFIFKYKNSQN
jgi:hypothetical protein